MKKQYTVEFKKEAVALAQSMQSICGAARQLGISDGLIHAWRKKFGDEKSSSLTLDPSEKEELVRLRKKVSELEKVNFILKKAAAFFSQDHLK